MEILLKEKTEEEIPAVSTPLDEDGVETDTPPESENASPVVNSNPAGSFRVITAEETEHKKTLPDGTGVTGGSTAVRAPSQSAGPSASAQGPETDPMDLPAGNAPDAATGGATPMTASSAPRLASIDGGGVDGALDGPSGSVNATGVTPSALAPGLADESGNQGMLFAILLLVAVALPVSAFLVLKMLR